MIAFVLLRVLLILLLVAANAFFAAAEFSLISVRDTRIQQLIESGRTGARIVQRLHQHLDEVVNGVQLGITMVSLTLGWIGEPMVARLVESLRFVQEVPHAAVYAHGIAIAVAFSLITYLHVLLGELVPKTLALQRAEQVSGTHCGYVGWEYGFYPKEIRANIIAAGSWNNPHSRHPTGSPAAFPGVN